MAKYELEDDEKTLMEEVFNLAQKFVDLQIDDATAEELQDGVEHVSQPVWNTATRGNC